MPEHRPPINWAPTTLRISAYSFPYVFLCFSFFSFGYLCSEYSTWSTMSNGDDELRFFFFWVLPNRISHFLCIRSCWAISIQIHLSRSLIVWQVSASDIFSEGGEREKRMCPNGEKRIRTYRPPVYVHTCEFLWNIFIDFSWKERLQ